MQRRWKAHARCATTHVLFNTGKSPKVQKLKNKVGETDMKLMLIGTAVALVTVPALAQIANQSAITAKAESQTRADAEARVRERLGAMDANKDGTVSPDEARSHAEAEQKASNDAHFAAMDTDKNGSISRVEFDVAHAGNPEIRRPRMIRMMRHDGPMTSAQAPGGADHHGSGHEESGHQGASEKPREMRIMMMDRSMTPMAWRSDGKGIVIEEAVKMALRRFDAADTNKDGRITNDERKAARGSMMERMRATRS
jgi:hypothetical protein